jgi:malto-oligosyltrehalose synthase
MYNPISTYRLQFNRQFNFREAEKLVEYFQELGIGTIYASPVFEAVPGSIHGYDGINFERINPEIGGRDDLAQLTKLLHKYHIGWLQDIVPNHMAYDTRNPWLLDVLEKGKQSPYSDFFDIRWSENDSLMAPFLASDLDSAIHEGNIKLVFKEGRFFLQVFEQIYPVSPKSYSKILNQWEGQVPVSLEELSENLAVPEENELKLSEWDKSVSSFASTDGEKERKTYIESCLDKINGSEKKLREIIDLQEYRLCHWQETQKRINYRRFFTVNNLICLNIHKNKIFDAFHSEILKLINEEVFQGLRIDHIDGLYDPQGYLEKLRKKSGEKIYIVVEKILEENEVIPPDWPVQGATGYSFLAKVNNLFTQGANESKFTSFYIKIRRDHRSLSEQIRSRKELILYTRMAGELDNLLTDFKDVLKKADISADNQKLSDIKKAIAGLLIECPVYRYYGRQMPLLWAEENAIATILERIQINEPEINHSVDLLKQVLLVIPWENNKLLNDTILHFYRRMMQITGPLMAKGVEDTLMYTYNRFIGHNEVGDSPERFGIDSGEWHTKMFQRQKLYPLTMNTTSTHDTKRGEDLRARLNVLTDLPDLWFDCVIRFREMNKELRIQDSPDLNDEYFAYLTLIGMYPMPGQPDNDTEERLKSYFTKALREAKLHSNWINPNTNYENAMCDFTISLLDRNRPFWKQFSSLHQKIVDFGIVNSLVQLTLKCMSPGLPDFYQGTELWDLNLVDPDNRKPVDFQKRVLFLRQISERLIENPETFVYQLWKERYNGRIKLWLMQSLLKHRRTHSDLFWHGVYIPVEVRGKYKNNVIAFIRNWQNDCCLVAVSLHLAALCNGDKEKILYFDWENTELILPDNTPVNWQNILIKSSAIIYGDFISIGELFRSLPFAVLVNT